MNQTDLKAFLESKVVQYNNPAFIEDDPIIVPHQYKQLQDIEIAGFFSAVLSWGKRSTIIRNAQLLMDLMDGSPYQFILNHQEKDLKRFLVFKHRTFNATDLLYFISFLKEYYSTFLSLEFAFSTYLDTDSDTTKKGLIGFQQLAFANEHPERTRKHISTPAKGSACKRLNMFLRWMVRSDHQGVDFGLWKNISPSQLIIPMDIHVSRVAKRMGLIENEKVTWKNAETLTNELRQLDSSDPVKYDFALFGLGVIEKFI